MIPKSLLTIFLSLRFTAIPGAPPQDNYHNVEAPAHAQRVDFHTPYHVPEAHNVEPAYEVQYDIKLKDEQQLLTLGASKGAVALTEELTFPVCKRSWSFPLRFFRPSKWLYKRNLSNTLLKIVLFPFNSLTLFLVGNGMATPITKAFDSQTTLPPGSGHCLTRESIPIDYFL